MRAVIKKKTNSQFKAQIKKAVKKGLMESGILKNVKVWNVEVDTDYLGKEWINIEISANKK